jgi:Methyltransferase domain
MPIRSAIGRVKDLSKDRLNSVLLGRQLQTLRRNLRDGSLPKPTTMDSLVRSWSNGGWSANGQLLTAMLEWFAKSQGTVVECGSGLSTLILAEACAASGPQRQLLSLEHEPVWAERVQSAARRHLRREVNIASGPLQNYGDFDWYSIPSATMPPRIGFVVCDGPPGSTRGGRYGFGPVLRPYLSKDCIVLLDDAHRPEEQSVIARWKQELGAVVLHQASTYSVLIVPQSAANAARLELSSIEPGGVLPGP